MRLVLVSIVLLGMIGCGGEPMAELIPIEKVPENTLKKAQEALPDVRFENAVRRSDGRLEVRGKDSKGIVRDVDFSAAGEVIEIE